MATARTMDTRGIGRLMPRRSNTGISFSRSNVRYASSDSQTLSRGLVGPTNGGWVMRRPASPSGPFDVYQDGAPVAQGAAVFERACSEKISLLNEATLARGVAHRGRLGTRFRPDNDPPRADAHPGGQRHIGDLRRHRRRHCRARGHLALVSRAPGKSTIALTANPQSNSATTRIQPNARNASRHAAANSTYNSHPSTPMAVGGGERPVRRTVGEGRRIRPLAPER